MSSQVKEVNWSELARDPTKVADLADAGDVRVIRRDRPTLLLIREDRMAATEAGAIAASRALRNLLDQMPIKDFVVAMRHEFAWVQYLPPADAVAFCRDFVDAARAAAELGQWRVLGQVVREWRTTAAIYSDPALARRLSRPITDDFGPVPIAGRRGAGRCQTD